MNSTRIIDVRGLEHIEKERLIFPSIEELKNGEVLRIILEFNPLPLVYMLKTQGEFEVSYEKEGPDEWILNIKKIAPKEDKKEYLKDLLKEIKGGKATEETKERAKEFFQAVDAKTLGTIEQELIREGIPHDEIRKSLCDIHLEILKEALVSKRVEISAPHPVNTFMEEHKIILNTLNELDSLIERIRDKNDYESLGQDREKLKDVSHLLIETEKHHQREEEVLFPALEKHNITEPAAIMKMDHAEFRKRKQELYRLSHNPQDYSFGEFKGKVVELGKYLTEELENHIFKEDNILYQIAFQVLSREEWEEVKRACDKIGYCCFTPEDQNRA